MNPTLIQLRLADNCDEQIIWEWVNDPLMLKLSFQTHEPVPFENHKVWFAQTLQRDKRIQYVAETVDETPIGQIRFEPITPSEQPSIVSVYLAPEWRGKKLAPIVIQLGTEQFSRETGVTVVDAWIKEENIASKRSFLAAGYKDLGLSGFMKQPAWHLRWSGD